MATAHQNGKGQPPSVVPDLTGGKTAVMG